MILISLGIIYEKEKINFLIDPKKGINSDLAREFIRMSFSEENPEEKIKRLFSYFLKDS